MEYMETALELVLEYDIFGKPTSPSVTTQEPLYIVNNNPFPGHF